MRHTLPVNLVVGGRPCVVIGGGAVAHGKILALESRGAKVTVVAPEVTRDIESLAGEGRIVLYRRPYEFGDLEGVFFAVSAISDPEVNAAVWSEAQERGVLLNVVDDPAHCTAVFPAIVRRGDLQIAVSTEGRSPALAVRIRQRLETEYGDEYALLLEILGEARPAVAGWGSQKERAELWYSIVDSGVLDMIRDGRVGEARELVNEWLSSRSG